MRHVDDGLNLLLVAVAASTVLAIGPDARRWVPWDVRLAHSPRCVALALALALLPAPGGVASGLALAACAPLWCLAALGGRRATAQRAPIIGRIHD